MEKNEPSFGQPRKEELGEGAEVPCGAEEEAVVSSSLPNMRHVSELGEAGV